VDGLLWNGHSDALQDGNEVLAMLSKHLSLHDPFYLQVLAFTRNLRSKVNRDTISADASSELATLMNLDMGGTEDDQDLAISFDDGRPPDLALLPTLLSQFEKLFWQHKYVSAHALAHRAVAWVRSEASGHIVHKHLWLDASGKLCRVLMRLAQFNDAIAHLHVVLDLEMVQGTPTDQLHIVEATVELACHLIEKGSYVQAEAELLKVASRDLARRLDVGHPVVCRMYYAQATLAYLQGDLHQALKKLRSAEAGQKERLMFGDSTYTQLYDTRLCIIEVLHAAHHTASAHNAANALQQDLEKAFGKVSFEGAQLKLLNACLLVEAANYKAADSLLREVTATVNACVGLTRATAHPVFLLATSTIATIGELQARYDEADFMYQKTTAGLTSSHLDLQHSLKVAEMREGYSKLQLPMGRPLQAIELLGAALEARRSVPGVAASSLFACYVLMARQEIALGHLTHARSSLDNMCAIQDATARTQAGEGGEEHEAHEADVKLVQGLLALELKHDVPFSVQCVRQALTQRQKEVPSDHPDLALHKLHLATALFEVHRLEEAVALAREVSVSLSYIYGKASAHMARVFRLQARVLMQRGMQVEAQAVVQDALAIDSSKAWLQDLIASGYQAAVFNNDKRPAVLQDLELLATILYGLGQLDAALRLLSQIKEVASEMYDTMHHPMIARVLVMQAKIEVYGGNYESAHAMLTKGLEVQLQMLGASHPDVLLTELDMVEMLQLVGHSEAALHRATALEERLKSATLPNSLQVLPLRVSLLSSVSLLSPSSLLLLWKESVAGESHARPSRHQSIGTMPLEWKGTIRHNTASREGELKTQGHTCGAGGGGASAYGKATL